jgi:hypothetical protein
MQVGEVDLRGVALLFAGAVLSAASFSVLTWYSASGGPDSAGQGFTFGDLHDNADQLGVPVATAYFDRFAWGLVALVVLVGVASKVRTPATAALRVAGFLAGIAGIVLTYYALAQVFNAERAAGGSKHSVFDSASYGFWAALAGYLVSAVGAVIATPGTDTPSRRFRRL